jgi:hypothetical protein
VRFALDAREHRLGCEKNCWSIGTVQARPLDLPNLLLVEFCPSPLQCGTRSKSISVSKIPKKPNLTSASAYKSLHGETSINISESKRRIQRLKLKSNLRVDSEERKEALTRYVLEDVVKRKLPPIELPVCPVNNFLVCLLASCTGPQTSRTIAGWLLRRVNP